MIDDGATDKVAMTRYCKAQATINQIDREEEERWRELNERLRTFRTLLTEELGQHEISCLETTADEQPIYVRLKPSTHTPTFDAASVVATMRAFPPDDLAAIAEKFGHDLPRMLVHMLTLSVRRQATSDKSVLSVSNIKERGFVRERQQALPEEIHQLARDFVATRNEMAALRTRKNAAKRPSLEVQREVGDTVREALKQTESMRTRVHMKQEGGEWLYYLKCQEREVVPPLGVRKLLPMVERVLASALDTLGVGREYNGQLALPNSFWDNVDRQLATTMDAHRRQTKTTSKLTFNRGSRANGK